MSKTYDIKFVIRTVGKRPDEWYNSNNYAALRYGKFLKGLEGKKAGFIQYQDILNKLYKNVEIPIYEFNPKTENFMHTNNKGLDATVVATEVFECEPVDFNTKKTYLDDTTKLYSDYLEQGRVQTYINSIESLASQDKKWLLDVQRDLEEIPLAPATLFQTKKELEEFYNDNEDKYILKGRLGMAGTGTMQLNKENLERITDQTVSNYVIQKDISPIACELRLVFGPDQTHLGTRAYFDRRAPWEDKKSNKKHKPIEYNISDYEKNISSKIIKYANVDVGSADWLIHLPKNISLPPENNTKEFSEFIQKHGTYSLAEVNGFGTNLGPLVSPYDLNEEVIKRIANKYM